MARTQRQHRSAFETWIDRAWNEAVRRTNDVQPPEAGLRFAFYGRTSTAEFQDQGTSHGWQRETAEALVVGHGTIVADFFDVGCSRRLPWSKRPRAADLLTTITTGGIDAVVIGEYERAFAADQLERLTPLLKRHGVQLWLPEAGGHVDFDDPHHHILMKVLAAHSHREVLRSRHRTLAAMRAQTCEQGRYLGGRPPYGYRLADAGPHPNRAHARWGRRLQRLEPDPVTAPTVRWIFTERLRQRSLASIARYLNERGVPCPAAADRERNPHRSGETWTVHSVAAVLGNPRYTGHQIWDRNPGRHDTKNARTGLVHPGRPDRGWAVSKKIVHPPLVSEEDFVAAQAIRSARPAKDGTVRVYLLTGLLHCRVCGRRMDAHWVNDRPGYRCRHGHNSAKPRPSHQPRNLYIREDRMLAALGERLPGHPSEIADHLRTHALIVVCDATTWTLTHADNAEGPIQTDLFDQLEPGPHPFMG